MDWKKLKGIVRFTPGEFSEDPERFASPGLIYGLNVFAIMLGSSVYPSPAPGALARFNAQDTSQHCAVNRLSVASDVFCNCHIFKAWATAFRCGKFNGVGVYFDTHYKGRLWPMLHLDQREYTKKALWFRDERGKYCTPYRTPHFYERLLARLNAKPNLETIS